MLDLRVGGLVPFSAADYPGQLAAVVFLQGCPWRCVYCHNPHLQAPSTPPALEWEDVLSFLSRRRGRLDAVVFSGGEPTLQAGLGVAMDQARALGFRVALHTGGMYPERLEAVLDRVDWVGLDLKAPLSGYASITGVPDSGAPVRRSLELLLARSVDHELRCTWHPSLLSGQDLERLLAQVEALGGGGVILQPYRRAGCADPLPEVPPSAAERLLTELGRPRSELRLREG